VQPPFIGKKNPPVMTPAGFLTHHSRCNLGTAASRGVECSGDVGNDDPRLDDAEDDAANDEPSLAGFDTQRVNSHFVDRELDESESGIADLDGLAEQFGRVA
jgi:hypothetical protein